MTLILLLIGKSSLYRTHRLTQIFVGRKYYFDYFLYNGRKKSSFNKFRRKSFKFFNHLYRYDCDFNNEPCLKNGSRAHWAVVCGYIDGGHEENFYVLACHGKSQFVSAWKFSELQLSNDNLNDLGPRRELDDNDYVIPSGGLKTGIASKSILFKKINSSLSYSG